MRVILKGKNFIIEELSRKHLKEAKKFQSYINSLIKEEAQILFNKKISLKEEKEWLKEDLTLMREKRQLVLIAREGKKIAGICNTKLEPERKNHIATLVITVARPYRNLGLGTRLIKIILSLAKKKLKPAPCFVRLWCFATNKPALILYRKMGFKKVARIPRQLQYKKNFVDEIIMLKKI